MNPTLAATEQPLAPATAARPYEAPAIESVLSPDDLQREVLYAGTISISEPPDADIDPVTF